MLYNKKGRISYRGIHNWIERQLGKPSFCKNCKDTTLKHRQYHWANISNNYNRDIKDWIRLCVKCHKSFDNKNMIKGKKQKAKIYKALMVVNTTHQKVVVKAKRAKLTVDEYILKVCK